MIVMEDVAMTIKAIRPLIIIYFIIHSQDIDKLKGNVAFAFCSENLDRYVHILEQFDYFDNKSKKQC